MTEPSLRDSIWGRQYAIHSDESFEEGITRVARHVAKAEQQYEGGVISESLREAASSSVYESIIRENKFIPGGRILAGSGTKHGNLLNCFVVDGSPEVPGSTDYALLLARKLAIITRKGGGTGVNLDVFAPKTEFDNSGVGRVYITINDDHADASNVRQGRYMDLVIGEYVTKGYSTVHFVNPNQLWGLGPDVQDIYVEDSTEGIWDAAAQMVRRILDGQDVLVHLHNLRPEGSEVRGSGGSSSGPSSFAVEIFDNFARWANLGAAEHAGPVATLRYVFANTLRVVRQGGTRRGAGMATLSVTHADIMDFVTSKDLEREQAEGDISTYNISVLASDEFMEKAISDDELGSRHYAEERELLNRIANHAWKTGEPGLIFGDTVNLHNPLLDIDGPITATNPCGEIPLYAGEPCCLGAINLSEFVSSDGRIDLVELSRVTRIATRFLDDVLTMEVSPLPEIHDMIQRNRRIGLGVMGLADMLIKMGLKYGSDEAGDMIRQVIGFIRVNATEESLVLAEKRGIPEGVKLTGGKHRNIAIMTVAPTGTTSMLAGVSSGIEPVFSAVTYRRIGTEYRRIIHPLLEELITEAVSEGLIPPFDEKGWDWLLEEISAADGSIQTLIDDGVLPDTPKFTAFRTAHDVTPSEHVAVQAAVQEAFDYDSDGNITYVGNSLSKTINLPNAASVEDVLSAYVQAYETGCKGITVYRDGSRDLQVLSTKSQDTTEDTSEEVEPIVVDEERTGPVEEPSNPREEFIEAIRKRSEYITEPVFPGSDEPGLAPVPSSVTRPLVVNGETFKFDVGNRKVYVTVNRHRGVIVEVFINVGRPTDAERVAADIIGRLISTALKFGAPVEDVVKHLRGHRDATGGFIPGTGFVQSLWEVVAIALEHTPQPEVAPALPEPTPVVPPVRFPEPETVNLPLVTRTSTTNQLNVGAAAGGHGDCPDCGGKLIRTDGCNVCFSCGYSSCG